MPQKLATFILLFHTFWLMGQNNLPEQPIYETAKAALANLPPQDPARIPLYLQLVEEYKWKNVDSSAIFYQKGIQLAQQQGTEQQLAHFYLIKGRQAGKDKAQDSLSYFANLAKAIFIKQADSLGIAKYHQLIAYQHYLKDEMDAALANDFKALNYLKTKNHPLILGDSYLFISLDYFWSTDNADKAIEFGDKALAIYQKHKDLTRLIYTYIVVGNYYRFEYHFSKAIDYLETGIALAEKYDYPLLARKGKSDLALVYLDQKDYAKGIALFESVNQQLGPEDAPLNHAMVKGNLGCAYMRIKDYPKAIQYLRNAIQATQESNNIYYLTEFADSLSKVFVVQAQYDSALAYKQLSLDSHLAIYESDKRKAIEQLKTQYETEQKETTIAQQAAQISRQRIIVALSLLIATLLAGGGFLLYRLTRQLRQRNVEKEFLIKEIHHRVKNNLQILSSLLYLQSRHIKDDNALEAIREGQNRVDSIGLLHQKLYQGSDTAIVDLADYLPHLGDNLLDSFGMEHDRIEMVYQLPPIQMHIDTAIPLGLIINELLTNALKYAFPNERKGKITIKMQQSADTEWLLEVKDNGVGKIGAPTLANSTSFGTDLVNMLSKKLKGTVTEKDDHGHTTIIHFKDLSNAY